jgi:hypothetical protein
MQSSFLLLNFIALCTICFGFRVAPNLRITPKLRLAEPEKGSYELVPVDKANIESAASFTGALLGLVLFGPIGAAVLAATVNYVSKKDNDAGEALRGLGKTVVESVNFLKKVDSKYELTDNVVSTVSSAVDNIKTESETIETVKKSLTTVVSKVKEVNDEYDLVSKGKEVIGIVGTLSDAALEKVDELNQKVS